MNNQLKTDFSFSLGSTQLKVSIFEEANSRLGVEFDVNPPEDKVFYHREKSKPYKPFIGKYPVKKTKDFYIALRALLLRDYKYSYNEFNNKGIKGSRTFRMHLNSPSTKNAYGVIFDYVNQLNGEQSNFSDTVRSLMEKSLKEEDDKAKYITFSHLYKKEILKANFMQFSSFLEDAYQNIGSYDPEQFLPKEVFNALYPYQQVVMEFMHTTDEARYTLLYLDYYIIQVLKEEMESILEKIPNRKSSIYGIQKDEKSPIPVLVIDKKEDKRDFILLPFGSSGSLNKEEFKVFKKAVDYYIDTGVPSRFVSSNGVGLLGKKNSLVLSVGGKLFEIKDRKTAAHLVFNLM